VAVAQDVSWDLVALNCPFYTPFCFLVVKGRVGLQTVARTRGTVLTFPQTAVDRSFATLEEPLWEVNMLIKGQCICKTGSMRGRTRKSPHNVFVPLSRVQQGCKDSARLRICLGGHSCGIFAGCGQHVNLLVSAPDQPPIRALLLPLLLRHLPVFCSSRDLLPCYLGLPQSLEICLHPLRMPSKSQESLQVKQYMYELLSVLHASSDSEIRCRNRFRTRQISDAPVSVFVPRLCRTTKYIVRACHACLGH
jgi:hypothetical protein